MTNWEKYFGSPEKTALMRIQRFSEDYDLDDGVDVWQGDELIETLWIHKGRSFEEWLKEEADE